MRREAKQNIEKRDIENGKADSYLVSFLPKGHRTLRITPHGRSLEHAMRCVQELKEHEATRIDVIKMDGFSGAFDVQRIL